MIRARRGWPFFVVFLPACLHWDLGDRAPAHVEVMRPPADLAARTIVPGRDPGESWFVVRPGPFLGAQSRFDRRRDAAGRGLGFELSLTGGSRPTTHTHPSLPLPFFGPQPGVAAALNLGLVHTFRPFPDDRATALYAEVQASEGLLGGVAAGWSWAPPDGGQGPQVTGFYGPLYFRATHHLGRHTTVGVGVFFKGELAWAWSR